MSKTKKQQEPQAGQQTTEDQQAQLSTSTDSSIPNEEFEALKQRCDDLEAAVQCLLRGVHKVETKFGQKFMVRGEFYGIEFK